MIYVGADTKVSAATTVQNFGDYSSVSDDETLTLRDTILNAEDTIKSNGITWYISNDGDDSNAGNTPDKAWKTLNALTKNANKIKSGDAVLLKRGDIFRGTLKTKNGVSYGAYGTGDKPAIYGCKTNYAKETWVRTDYKNIYSLIVDTSDIGMIVFNHGEAYGYKMLESVSECDSDYEFYHDKENGVIYLYCSDGRPSDVFYDIELLYDRFIVHIPDGCENVYIENITAKYTGAHGISVGMPANGITIKNCEIGWIGGSIHREETNTRYGNGIQFYGQTTNAVVDHCWVYQCYDAGLTHQYSGSDTINPEMNATNITYTNNLVEYCSYSLEYFWGWKVDAIPTDNNNVYMKDILVENNIMRFAGYGLGQTRPDPINMGHIVTWFSSYNPIDNFVIKNNIFDMSTLRLFAVGTYEEANPIFSGNRYVQSTDNVLGIAYTENMAKGGEIAKNADALYAFDSTGTLIIVE